MNAQGTTPVPVVPAQPPAQAPPPLVITLVHGTKLLARWRFWSSKPQGAKTPSPQGSQGSIPRKEHKKEWFEEGSQFCNRLLKALGMPCVVTNFKWSGANGEWARLCAAGADADFRDGPSAAATPSAQMKTLREHIAEHIKKYPDAAHVLIAHSHGGNVCLAALNDKQTRQAVRALVCLSTPFINVRGRADSPTLMDLSQVAGIIIFGVAFLASVALIDKWVPEPWGGAIWGGLLIATFLLYILYSLITGERSKALRRWASVKRHGFAAPPVLALMSDGDEALLVLKIAEGLNAALRGLWPLAWGIPSRIFTAQRRLGDNLRVSFPILAVAVSVVLAVGLAVDDTSPLRTGNWSLLIVLKFLGMALIATVLLFCLWVFVLALPGLIMVIVVYFGLAFVRWLAFGWVGYLGIDMTAETCPVGTAQVTRLGPSLRARGLHHGHSYNDRRAPIHIARFIRETMALEGT